MPHVMVSTKTQENKDHLCGWETGGELTSKKILEISCTLMVGKVWYTIQKNMTWPLKERMQDGTWMSFSFLLSSHETLSSVSLTKIF